MVAVDCIKLDLSNINMMNTSGSGRLFSLSFSNINFSQSFFSNLTSKPPTIFEISSSNLSMKNVVFNNFYPRLISASDSGIVVINCTFYNSTSQGIMQPMTVFYFEYNINFSILNCLFDNLKNNYNGPVTLILHYS